MGTEWFYEYEGKKVGPIPSETLRHLARHGAILRQSIIWKSGVAGSFPADKIRGLFDSAAIGTGVESDGVPSEAEQPVLKYLREVLDACCADADGDLMSKTPQLGFIAPWPPSKGLLAYDVRDLRQLPTPVVDMSLPLGKRTKPVAVMFQAKVHVVLCVRPSHPTTVAEVHRLQPGRHEDDVELICKNFDDGSWIFLDASLEA